MTLRAHAALWLSAIAMAWLFFGAGTDLASSRSVAIGAAAVPHSVAALIDSHVLRMHTNVLRCEQALWQWVDLAPAWAPVVLAGVLDGVASRRARRCSLEAAPDLALHLGRHALVALSFAPILWASCGPSLAAPLVWMWAIALSVMSSFTLSRVQGLALRG